MTIRKTNLASIFAMLNYFLNGKFDFYKIQGLLTSKITAFDDVFKISSFVI